jgi:methionine-rich copper-binding protein CopC
MAQEMKLPKQPWETYQITMDFDDSMDADEDIYPTLSAVTCADSAGEDVSSDIIDGSPSVQDRTKLAIQIKGGISKKRYKVTFRAHISSTKKLEEDLFFTVKD